MRSASFADLADALFGSKKSLKPAPTVLPRPKSALNLHHTTNTRRRHTDAHLPTTIINRILSHCSLHTLAQCLSVSRLFFHIAGCQLYSAITLGRDDFRPVLYGSTIVHEAVTGKVAVGRKRFKDRLLKHVGAVTLLSHGEDDDDDDEEANREGCREAPPCCPPVPLSVLMPKLELLRVVLSDDFDYHCMFCPRYPRQCPLLVDLSVDKLVILGARTPLVVLPIAFPSNASAPSTAANTPPLLSSPTMSAVDLPTKTKHHHHGHLHPPLLPTSTISSTCSSRSGKKTPPRLSLPPLPLPLPPPPSHSHHSPRLPQLQDLTIVLPTGLSYDAKDYTPYSHVFRHKRNIASIRRLAIIFYTRPRRPWQTAFYDARRGNYWTSFMSLCEDMADAALAVPPEAEVVIVGVEGMDGELLNMGIGAMREGRVGGIVEDAIRRRIEVKGVAGGMGERVLGRVAKVKFVKLKTYVQSEEAFGELDGEDIDAWL
ncbi:hypothetical protein IAT38_005476 [Cryptococcus sp. DSM 104549]